MILKNYLEERKLKKLSSVKPNAQEFYRLGCDLITETMVNQHNTFGSWEIRRTEILYALLDEFLAMTASNYRCKEMEEALSADSIL
jgi:hypothetical protein